MRARVYLFDSYDIDLDTFVPDDPLDAAVWVRMMVGPDGGELGVGESFDVLVCTPRWLLRTVEEGPQIGHHHLFVHSLTISEALDFLRREVESLQASDWPSLGAKIGRIGLWEFADYDDSADTCPQQ